jgi:hypothetical protein
MVNYYERSEIHKKAAKKIYHTSSTKRFNSDRSDDIHIKLRVLTFVLFKYIRTLS